MRMHVFIGRNEGIVRRRWTFSASDRSHAPFDVETGRKQNGHRAGGCSVR